MESTLSLTRSDLEGEIGYYLGLGRGADNGDTAWAAKDQAIVQSARKSGERQFYHPITADNMPYVWSFLRPVATMTLTQALPILPLPDDFGGLEGEMTVSVGSTQCFETVPQVSDVRHLYSLVPTATGRPRNVAVEPLKGTDYQSGQRFQAYFFPSPDQTYTLQFQYYVHPDAMSGARPYAYGGMAHAETLLAAVLAAAELYQDDERGVRYQYFQERLQASINADRKLKPQQLGMNRDRSDWKDNYWGRGEWRQPTVTFHGLVPGS